MEKIGFVGGGNMAQALIKGVIGAEVYTPENIYVSDIRVEKLEFLGKEYGVKILKNNNELASSVYARGL